MQTCKSGPINAVLHEEKKTQIRAGTHIDLSFWCKSRCFASTNRQVKSGTLDDFLCRSKVAVLHPQTTHEGWDP